MAAIEAEEAAPKGGLMASKAERLAAEARLVAEARALRVVNVSEPVRLRIAGRLAKLERRLLDEVRRLHTRRREYTDVSDGLSALCDARSKREADMAGLLLQSREYSAKIPNVVKAMKLFAPPQRLGAPIMGA